jgi:pimeloyl-ACP methyl ester carboxylesterase
MLKRAIVAMVLVAFSSAQHARENVESVRIPSGIGSLQLSLLHVRQNVSDRQPPVLIVHGATFPSGNAAAWKIDGKSWMDDLAEHGYDVYALDFLGYGESDNYPEMAAGDSSGPALGNVSSMVRQIESAVATISTRHPDAAVHLIAHSAGTLAAARYTELHPKSVARLVLFGPPAAPTSTSAGEVRQVRYFDVTADDQLNAFEPRVRQSGKLDLEMFATWASAYLASDANSASRQPPSVRVPGGMRVALDELDHSGNLPYDPTHITTPTLIIQGEWDAVTPSSDSLRLFEQFAAPMKRLVVVSQAGHRMHLEQNRRQLYREVRAFLQDEG